MDSISQAQAKQKGKETLLKIWLAGHKWRCLY